MRYTRVVSQVQVIGRIWMPDAVCAMDYTLSAHDLENIRDGRPLAEITREDIAGWLSTHAGDFQEIIDFRADLSEGSEDKVIDWENEENELTYYDCMFPAERLDHL